ncbi:hypothetical protein LZ30DRAFT_239412 [Colletotrichum cereale]|nr:hypothetical protein LZ30DRAFT_239412 [Colletotrichum cereale]
MPALPVRMVPFTSSLRHLTISRHQRRRKPVTASSDSGRARRENCHVILVVYCSAELSPNISVSRAHRVDGPRMQARTRSVRGMQPPTGSGQPWVWKLSLRGPRTHAFGFRCQSSRWFTDQSRGRPRLTFGGSDVEVPTGTRTEGPGLRQAPPDGSGHRIAARRWLQSVADCCAAGVSDEEMRLGERADARRLSDRSPMARKNITILDFHRKMTLAVRG